MSLIKRGSGEYRYVNDGQYYIPGKTFIGVDQALAKVESTVIDAHNLDQNFIDGIKDGEIPISIAALGIFTNLILPPKLRHPHPELQKVIGSDELSLRNLNDIQLETISKGLDLLSIDMRENSGLYPSSMSNFIVVAAIQMLINKKQYDLSKYVPNETTGIALKQKQ